MTPAKLWLDPMFEDYQDGWHVRIIGQIRPELSKRCPLKRSEVYRKYIVITYSVTMFVCLCVCLLVNLFSVKDFATTTSLRILIFEQSLITLVNVNAPVVATTSWWLHFSAPVVA